MLPAVKNERRSLLVAEVTSSNCSTPSSSGDEEDSREPLEHCTHGRNKQFSKYRYRVLHARNSSQCNVRRLVRLLPFILLVPFLVLMLYLPLYSSVQTRQAALSDWSYDTSRNIADYVLPDNATNLIEPQSICRDEKVFILIVVCSGVHNFAARQTIRETWGNTTQFNYAIFAKLHAHLKGYYLEPAESRLKYYNEYFKTHEKGQTTIMPTVRVVFLIGRTKESNSNETQVRLRSESEQYDDIVQENFIDTYNNLTLKSVLALKWVARRCLQHSAFFMKCDDDTFVNVPNLLHFLLGGTVPLYNDTLEFYDAQTYKTLASSNRLNRTRNYLAGHLFCTSRPVANVSSKWYIPYYMYPKDKFPRYLSGAGYLMTMDVVLRLYETALNTTLISLEDVYITGMCADKAHLQRRHHPLFSYTRAKQWCTFKGTITQHEVKDDSMAEAYSFVANMSQRCPPPGKYFKRMRLNKHSNCT